MKKKSLKLLTLNKSIITNLNLSSLHGGADVASETGALQASCICKTSKEPDYCIPLPDLPGLPD